MKCALFFVCFITVIGCGRNWNNAPRGPLGSGTGGEKGDTGAPGKDGVDGTSPSATVYEFYDGDCLTVEGFGMERHNNSIKLFESATCNGSSFVTVKDFISFGNNLMGFIGVSTEDTCVLTVTVVQF